MSKGIESEQIVSNRELGYRAMARAMARLVPISDDAEVFRASGVTPCKECGLPLFRHPAVLGSSNTVIACTGKIYKL